MKVELRYCEVELFAENDHERDALARLLKTREVRILPGKSIDHSWPPDPRLTNVILKFPNPESWGN